MALVLARSLRIRISTSRPGEQSDQLIAQSTRHSTCASLCLLLPRRVRRRREAQKTQGRRQNTSCLSRIEAADTHTVDFTLADRGLDATRSAPAQTFRPILSAL